MEVRVTVDGRLWLVGAGNMGGAMLARWIDDGTVRADRVTVIDPTAQALPNGVRRLDAPPVGEAPDTLVLAVKPQQLDAVASSLGGITPGLLISILAGVETVTLATRIPARAIVRAMPNLPVSIGKGVVALHSDSGDTAVRTAAEALMAPLGLVEWIADETLFHAVTALSGSGPGFVYRFIDALAAAGATLGLPADQSLRFATATVEGAAALGAASDEPPAALAERVASPGGTTRAGLDILDAEDAMRTLVAATLTAAANRSEQLSEAAR